MMRFRSVLLLSCTVSALLSGAAFSPVFAQSRDGFVTYEATTKSTEDKKEEEENKTVNLGEVGENPIANKKNFAKKSGEEADTPQPPASAQQPIIEQSDIEAAKKAALEKPQKNKPDTPRNYIGEMRRVIAAYEDTLLKIGRKYNLGYVEMRSANPNVDVWIPGEGTEVTVPSMHLLPDAPREGIVVNLSEMRLYSFVKDPDNPITHPIGVGRDGLDTPTGETTIRWKKEGPTWRPTPRMRREDPDLPEEMPPGEDNPLGTHALYLGWPAYLIHGTHKPWGIGRRVSSGCIRMFPEDIITIFEGTPTGTKVNVIKEPVKIAWIGDTLYIEAHADEDSADDIEAHGTTADYDVPQELFLRLKTILGEENYEKLDWERVRQIVKERRGYPMAAFSKSGELAPLPVNIIDNRSEEDIAESISEAQESAPEESQKKTRKRASYNFN